MLFSANDNPCEAESITAEDCPDVEMTRKQYNPPGGACLGDEKTELWHIDTEIARTRQHAEELFFIVVPITLLLTTLVVSFYPFELTV